MASSASLGRRRTPSGLRHHREAGRFRAALFVVVKRDRQSPAHGKERGMAEYGTSVDTTAPAEKVWKIWSDMSTWGDWNPNVATMDWQGGVVDGSTGTMNTRAGHHHKSRVVDVVP